MFLGRKLLLSPVHHFVDDFTGIEPREHASSGFVGFDRVLAALGTHTKPKKAQPPATEQKLLGIVMNWREDGVELSPSADRVQRVSAIVKGCISTQRLTPHVAQRLADKLSFLTSTFFGQAGKAALHPAQARAAGLADAAGYKLNAVLSAALHSLQHLLASWKPKFVPFSPPPFLPVLYTDAFFSVGGHEVESLCHRHSVSMVQADSPSARQWLGPSSSTLEFSMLLDQFQALFFA